MSKKLHKLIEEKSTEARKILMVITFKRRLISQNAAKCIHLIVLASVGENAEFHQNGILFERSFVDKYISMPISVLQKMPDTKKIPRISSNS